MAADWKRNLNDSHGDVVTLLEESCGHLELANDCLHHLRQHVAPDIEEVTFGPGTLRGLMVSYLYLFQLKGGVGIADAEVALQVRKASAKLRDAIVSCAYGLMETDFKEEFLNLLDQASDGKVTDTDLEGQNLKAQLLKAYFVMYGHLQVLRNPKAVRKQRARARRTLADAVAHVEQHELQARTSTEAEDVAASSNDGPKDMYTLEEAAAAMGMLLDHADENVRLAAHAALRAAKEAESESDFELGLTFETDDDEAEQPNERDSFDKPTC